MLDFAYREPKDFAPGIGRAVADRTVARMITKPTDELSFKDIELPRDDATSLDDQVAKYARDNGLTYSGYHVRNGNDLTVRITLYVTGKVERESWADVAERVALGNCSLNPDDFVRELPRMRGHLRNATILMSGRHLQHGDENQRTRPMEVMTNCSTAATTFVLFYLLLNGSGVGRDYSDEIMAVDYANSPIVVPAIGWGHADVANGLAAGYLTVEDAKHLYPNRTITVFEVPDSREGWAEAFAMIETMAWQKRREEVLILDFSNVRPNGSPIGGMQGRPASGPAPMMSAIRNIAGLRDAGMPAWRSALYADHYCAAVVLVGGARRAARMSTKFWTDPGVLNFISVKAGGQFLWSSNNSVTVDAEFWKLVREAKENPVEVLSAYHAWAEKVYDAVIAAAYNDGTGEPGFINVDTFNLNIENAKDAKLDTSRIINPTRLSISQEATDLIAEVTQRGLASKYPMITNPCVTADTWVQTKEGPKLVADLIDVPFEARVDGKLHQATGFWKTGDKKVYRLKTARGFEVRATDNHKFLVETGRRRKLGGGYNHDQEWLELKDIHVGDRIVLDKADVYQCDASNTDFQKGWLLGEIVGDGGYNPEASYSAYLRFWGDEAESMASLAEKMVRENLSPNVRFKGSRNNLTNNTWEVGSACLDDLCEGLIEGGSKSGTVDLEMKSEAFVAGFVRGLFDADGSVQGSTHKGVSVRLAQSDLDRLKMVQRMLLRLGVLSTIYEDRRDADNREMPDGNGGSKVYATKACHELVVSNTSVVKFHIAVGFFEPEKAQRLLDVMGERKRLLNEDNFTSEVTEIIEDGFEAVYDCTVNDVHRFSANGLIAHNCGEIQLVKWGGYCVIADVVPFHAESDDEAEDAFRTATRALIRTNLMDCLYAGEVKRTNRIGVGFTGIHEYALKRFGFGWKDLVNEQVSKDFWKMMARFSRAVKQEAKAYSKLLGVVVPHTDTTVKPAGCAGLETTVKTTDGVMTMAELFEKQGFTKDMIEATPADTWIEPKVPMQVLDMNNEAKDLTKLYVNGVKEVFEITFEDGVTVKLTGNHKLMTESGWKRVDELTEQDEIIHY